MESDRSIYRDQQGRIDDYLRAVGQTEEEFKERYREDATKRVLRSLVLQEVAKREEIEVSETDIDAEIDKMLEGTTEENREPLRGFFNSEERRGSIRRTMTGRRTLDRLIAVATHQETEAPTTQEPAPAPEAAGQPQT